MTNHYKNKRYKREKFIHKYINGDGEIIDEFIINRGHKNGLEIHQLTDNAIIIIKNYNSGKLISKLIARENQIKRYYKLSGRTPPAQYERALYLARWHESLGYNHV